MASDFILQIICRIHQIWNPKSTLFWVKISEKWYNWIRHTDCTRNNFSNKTRDVRLFIQCSRLDVTVCRICIIATLTASVNAAMNASVKRALLSHGFSFSKLPCGYKRQGRGLCQKHQSVAAMAYPWCSCSRPPDVCRVLFSKKC